MAPTNPHDTVVALAHAPRHGDLFTLTVDRIAPDGRGVCDLIATVGPQAEARRFTVRIRKAMVGDTVRAFVETRRRGDVGARIDAIVTPSVDRVDARCPHFGPREVAGLGCGGCTLQALDYPAQLGAKQALIRRAFDAAKLATVDVAPVRPAADPWRYRNKMEFSFGDDRERRFALGMRPTGWRREVVPLTACHLTSEATLAVAMRARDWAEAEGLTAYRAESDTGFVRVLVVREGKRTGERMVDLVTTHAETAQTAAGAEPAADVVARFAAAMEGAPVTSVMWTQHRAVRGERTRFISHHLFGAEVYHDLLRLPDGRELTFAVSPRTFFQPHPAQAEALCAEVIARLGAARVVLDLYCGTGTMGLCVAGFVGQVVGVELIAEAVADARANAAANGLTNTAWIAGDVGEVLVSTAQEPWRREVDAVIVDPPRAGLLPQAVAQLVALAPPRVIYVSCNPVALARDIAALGDAGYRLEGAVQPVDMFPHTAHVECVATLVRGR